MRLTFFFSSKILKQIFTAKFNAYLKFTRNIIESSQMGQWSNKLATCRRWVVRTRARKFFLQKIRSMRWKKKFTSKNRKSYKNAQLSPHSTLNDAVDWWWKKFFSPLFTANLTSFFDKTSTRAADQSEGK